MPITQQQSLLSSAEIELYGRQIVAHLDMAAKHRDKYHNNRKSAALLLIAVKAQLPRGQFDPWLDSNTIARSTAYRLIQEHTDPAVEQRRQEAQRAADAAAKAMRANRPMHGTVSKPAAATEPPRPEPKHYEQPAQPISLAGRRIRLLIVQYPDAPVWESLLPVIEQRLKDDQ